MNKDTLKNIIMSNEEYIHKYIKSIVKREISSIPASLKKVAIFYGVRRSGKTFILFDLFKKSIKNSVYIDFEDDRLQDFKLSDFEKLREAVFELKPELIDKKLMLYLDEVQNISGWEKFCRRAMERENIQIVVTGSSSRIMPYEIHTELRGREWSTEVLPFSFREYLHSKKINPNDEKIIYGKDRFLVKKHFEEYLTWGGFPELSYTQSEFDKRKLLKEYMSAMFFRDLVERYTITNIKLLEALMDKMFSSFSTKLSLNSFYKQYKNKFPFSKDLLFRYYGYILDSMLVFEVRKFKESVYERTRSIPKLYLVDTGLCKNFSSKDVGRRLENAVYLELRRREYDIFYHSEKRECDFIAVKDGNYYPIQVTYALNDNNRKREIEGLIEAVKRFQCRSGVIITNDEEYTMNENGIEINVIPLWKWLLSSAKM